MTARLLLAAIVALGTGCGPEPTPEAEPVTEVPQAIAFEGKVRFLGRVREASEIPASLADLEYPDALAAYVVEPLLPLPWQEKRAPIVVLAQVMADHQPTESTEVATGQGVSVDLVTAATAPEAMRTMQRFDTLEFLATDVFYAVDFEPRGVPAGQEAPPIALDGQTAMDRTDRSGRDAILAAEPSKQAALVESLRQTRDARQRYGEGEWSRWHERLAPFRQDIQSSVNHQWATGPDVTTAVSLDSLIEGLGTEVTVANEIPALANQLGQLGIDFIYVSVPVKVEAYPEKFSPRLPADLDRVNPARTELLGHLAEQGVEVLDLEPLFLAHRQAHPDELLYMPGKDPHFSPVAAEIAGRAIADRLRQRTYAAPYLDQVDYEVVDEPRDWGTEWGWKETTPVIARRVREVDTGTFYDTDPDSAIAICGDSHIHWWQYRMAENAGVAAHVSRHLGYPVVLEGARGGLPHELDRLSLEWYAKRRCVVLLQTTHLIHNFRYPLRKIRFPEPDAP